jgi:hypothetical protein
MRLLLTANTCTAPKSTALPVAAVTCSLRAAALACLRLPAPMQSTSSVASVAQHDCGLRNEGVAQAPGAPRKATRAKYCRKPKTLACVMLERKRRAGHDVVQSRIGGGSVPISHMVATLGQKHCTAEDACRAQNIEGMRKDSSCICSLHRRAFHPEFCMMNDDDDEELAQLREQRKQKLGAAGLTIVRAVCCLRV